jgi:hypothetical protein
MRTPATVRCPLVSPGPPAINVVLSHRIGCPHSETIAAEKRS